MAAPLVAAAAALAVVAGTVAAGQAATAALLDVPPTGAPGRLLLSSEPMPAVFPDLSPGDPAYWQVSARLEDADSATLALELRKDGALVDHPRGLTVGVQACDAPWGGRDAAPVCSSGARDIAVATPADDYARASPTFPLRPLTQAAPEYLLVTLAVEDSAAAAADPTLMGLPGTVGLGLTATAIDDIPVSPALPATGVDFTPLWGLGLVAAGFLGIGWAVRLARTGKRA